MTTPDDAIGIRRPSWSSDPDGASESALGVNTEAVSGSLSTDLPKLSANPCYV
jgi:hypothetical protein